MFPDNEIERLVREINALDPVPIPEAFSSIDKMMDNARDFAVDVLVGEPKEKELIPVWAMVTKSGQTLMFATPFYGGEETKEAVAQAMRLFMERVGVVRYTFMSEAWAAQTSKSEWTQDQRPPSQRDDRTEIVLICGGEKDKTVIDSYEMVRDWQTGSVVELKQQDMGRREEHNFTGRFANLLIEDDG